MQAQQWPSEEGEHKRRERESRRSDGIGVDRFAIQGSGLTRRKHHSSRLRVAGASVLPKCATKDNEERTRLECQARRSGTLAQRVAAAAPATRCALLADSASLRCVGREAREAGISSWQRRWGTLARIASRAERGGPELAARHAEQDSRVAGGVRAARQAGTAPSFSPRNASEVPAAMPTLKARLSSSPARLRSFSSTTSVAPSAACATR